MSDTSPSSEVQLLRLLVHVRDNQRRDGEGTGRAIAAEAMTLFTQLGYGGTSMRAIAAAVGIQAASIYAHFPGGKQQILNEGLKEIYDEFLAHISATLSPNMGPLEQFDTALYRHVTWQLDYETKALASDAAFGGLGVHGSLTEETRCQIGSARRLYHEYLESLVRQFSPSADVSTTTQAALTLCDNARRLRSTPEATTAEVARTVVELAHRIADVPLPA